MIRTHIGKIAGMVLMAGLMGCQTYYQVTEQPSGKIFYTNKVDRKENGAVEFKDLKTGDMVTLQSSGIKEISGSDLPGDAKK